MSFRDPTALLGLLLAVPLVALYLVRPRAREARVGSLLLYRSLSKRLAARASIARVEKLLSLLLHLGALAGIVLALAGPTWGPLAPRRIVVVLDASASMASRFEGSTRFERAVTRARALASELRGDDALGFVLAGATPHVLLAPAPRTAHPERVLDGIAFERGAGGGKTNLRDALELASALAPTETWLLSDGADPALTEKPSRGYPLRGCGQLYYETYGGPEDPNVGIVSLSARAVPGSDDAVEVQATLLNASSRTVSVKPTYSLERIPLVALEPVELGPWSRVALPPRRLELAKGGVIGLHVETPGDVLDLDDDAYVVLPPGHRVRVSEPEGIFLRAALAADDAVTLAPRDDAELVLGERFVVGPEDVAAIASRIELRDAGDCVPSRVSKVAREHPVLRHVALDDAVFARARRVEAPPSWRVLVAAGDVPLVLAREQGNERTLVFTFAPGESDLVLRRAWPLLVANAVAWIRGEALRESAEPARAGEVARIACERPVTAVRAGAESVPFVFDRGFASVATFARPDVYELFSGEERVGELATALLDEEESRVASRPHLGIGEKPAPTMRRPVESVDLETALPLAALALLLVEWFAHHRRGA